MSREEDQFNIKIFNSILNPKCEDDIEEKILSPLSCLREFESKWVLEVDLPLVDKKNITVTLDPGNVISVEAQLKEAYFDLNLDYKNEFRFFKKTVSLPGKIDDKNISANFTNGRLVIQIPKILKGNKITVE